MTRVDASATNPNPPPRPAPPPHRVQIVTKSSLLQCAADGTMGRALQARQFAKGRAASTTAAAAAAAAAAASTTPIENTHGNTTNDDAGVGPGRSARRATQVLRTDDVLPITY